MRHALLIVAVVLCAEAGSSAVPVGDPPELVARSVWLTPPDFAQPGDSGIILQPVDPWFSQDKALHFGASFLITLSQQYFLESRMNLPRDRAWPVSAGTAFSLGLFKELADSQRERNPLFSWRDMAWNTAGVGAALVVILL